MIGDIIGCCIDLDAGQMTFYRNGESMGVAFNNVRCGENAVGLAYFPAISLSYGEKCLLNFGSRPFEFPVEGYNALHQSHWTNSSPLEKAQYLTDCLYRLMPYLTEKQSDAMDVRDFLIVANILKIDTAISISSHDAVILFASALQHLGPLLEEEYITVTVFQPFLERLICENREDYIVRVIDLMFLCAEVVI
jgi:Kip1 ubiquitination-promoting complex protein 1